MLKNWMKILNPFSWDYQRTLQKERTRLDDYLVASHIATDKKHALSLILSNSVLVNDRPITKIGYYIQKTDNIRLREKIKNYVSRGAFKLLGAFSSFPKLNITDLVCLDIGASTGGFTQVLLEKSAKHVYAIDVGYGQLSQRLANDPRVTVIDRTHIKELQWSQITLRSDTIFLSMDLSFISLVAVMPHVTKMALQQKEISMEGIMLIKPQFEVPSHFLAKGVVKSRPIQLQAIRNVWRSIKKSDPLLAFLGLAESPIQGADGNHEFLIWWRRKRF